MKIEVLGTGCKNCNALEAATAQALEQLNMDVPIDKVTDYGEIVAYGVMSTPALAIDGEVRTTGRVPSVREISEILTGAAV
ncbi:MAG: thioredoxin family protein [Actinomycetota bacterium]|nr:thioredoxin family protein [Actinomycetota bacterium]